MSTDVKDAEFEESTAGQLVAANQLPPNLMLMKMENETMMSAARVVPRDPKKIVAQLVALIEAYPQSADDAIYSKPVGTVDMLTCAECGVEYEKKWPIEPCKCGSRKTKGTRKQMKHADGLSIRAAESIRSIYGYNRLAVNMSMSPDGTATISCTFVDYAACQMTSDERVVSPHYKTKEGEMKRTPVDRFINVVVKAEKSKLRRDMILDSIPNEIKAAYRDACEKKLLGMVTPEKIMKEVVPAFATLGVSLPMLEKIVGRTVDMGWTESDRLSLKKIYTGLKNGETTVADLMADFATEGNGGKTPSNLDELAKRLDGETEQKTEPLDPIAHVPSVLALCLTIKEVRDLQEDLRANSNPPLDFLQLDRLVALCDARELEIEAAGKKK